MNQREPLQPATNCATMQPEQPQMVLVPLADLEKEHSLLIARLHWIRDKLGYPPLQTGKEVRRTQAK